MRLASFTFDALFRLQNEVHIDGIVVGVAVACVDDIGGDGFDVVGHEEAVDRDAEGRLLVVGFVGRAAGGDGVFGVKRHDKGEPVGDRPLGDGCAQVSFSPPATPKISAELPSRSLLKSPPATQ